jgi:predicted pyridoxine 5'-phosphate oxidase superfamily flavin-nucleotide-binding protein
MTPPSPPPDNFGDLAFTPVVKAVQERLGSRRAYGRLTGVNQRTRFGPEERAFIEQRDTFYVATVGENGWPYVQHRGGPKGFLRVLDEQTLGFADFRGNRQYVTTGNVSVTHHACLFLMDYPNQTRLKIWAEAETSEDTGLIQRLVVPDYPATVERAFLFRVLAFDWNCEQHIIRRFTPDEYIAEFGSFEKSNE